MGVKLFTSNLLQSQMATADLQELVKKFRAYKDHGDHATFFGRDVDYSHPSSVKMAGLMHVHMADAKTGPFNLRIAQFNRVSNTALVYCPGFYNADHLLLISLLHNAHMLYKTQPTSWFPRLVELAEGFRSKY